MTPGHVTPPSPELWFPRWLNKCVAVKKQLTCELKMLREPRTWQGSAWSMAEKPRINDGPRACGRINV